MADKYIPRLGNPIRISEMDKRVEIYAPAASTSSTGEVSESFSLSATVWAKRISVAGSEKMIGGKEINRYIARWVIRTRTIDETYKLKYDGDYYDIEAVEEHSKKFLLIRSFRA